MPGVTKEQIARAKEWDLLSYLQRYEPGELKKCGTAEYCTKSHDSLRISNGKWHWHSSVSLDISLKAFVYEMYSRDVSERIRSVKHIKMRRGEYQGIIGFYGYKRSDAAKGNLRLMGRRRKWCGGFSRWRRRASLLRTLQWH